MLLWQMHVAGNNETFVRLPAKCPVMHWNKRMCRLIVAFFRRTVWLNRSQWLT